MRVSRSQAASTWSAVSSRHPPLIFSSKAVQATAATWISAGAEVLVDSRRRVDEVVQNEVVVLEERGERRIDVDLLYPSVEAAENAEPAQVEPRPLIVWLNGLGGRSGLGNPVPYALGKAGFVVVTSPSAGHRCS